MVMHPSDRPESARDWPLRSGVAPRRRSTYSVAEAAELLGISRSTAYECVHRGEIPALRFGQRLVIPAAALDDMLQQAVQSLRADAPGRPDGSVSGS